MSSPTRLSKSPVGIREPTRVILREITASLQNSPPIMSPGKKPINDSAKLSEHEVKVKFAREFAEAAHPPESVSISSGSSFQSLISTVSSKSLKFSPPASPTPSNISYSSHDVSGLDDLISACAGIRLEDTLTADQSLADASFTSASDEPINGPTVNDATHILGSDLNGTQVLTDRLSPLSHQNFARQYPEEAPEVQAPEVPTNVYPDITVTISNDEVSSDFKSTTESLSQSSDISQEGEQKLRDNQLPEVSQVPSESQIVEENSIPEEDQVPEVKQIPGEVSEVDQLPEQKEIHEVDQLPEENQRPKVDELPEENQISRVDQIPDQDQIHQDDQTPSAVEIYGNATATSIADATYHKVKALDLTFDSEGPSLPTLPSVSLGFSGEFRVPVSLDEPPQPIIHQHSDPAVHPSDTQEFPISNISDCISRVAEPTFLEEQKDLEVPACPSVPEPPQESTDPQEWEKLPETCDEPPESCENPSENCNKTVEIYDKSQEQCEKSQETSEVCEKPQNCEVQQVNCKESLQTPGTPEAPLEDTSDPEELDNTITFQESQNLSDAPEAEQYEAFKPQRQSTDIHPRPFPPIPTPSEYNNFLPHRQSTGLSEVLPPPNDFQSDDPDELVDDQRFFDAAEGPLTSETITVPAEVFDNKLRLEAETIADDIINASLQLPEDGEHFATANSNELFRDPSTFDFFESQALGKSTVDNLRRGSLFIKFDPLVSDVSMLPQGNTASPPEERNGEKEREPSITTPKRNPAIAAIDRLLFYSPMPPQKEEVEKIEEKTPEPVPVVDSATVKELELVRSTVLQLEEQLEKEKEEREKERKEAEKQTEMISQLQKHLAQEIKSKNQINVVVDEYEKSISRLVAERERDKKSLDEEKTILVEELQDTKNHLMASEAAFNDVHAKYERLKVVVNTFKSNEAALRESLAENVEIIKGLENRYEQIKTHAAARLEKANLDLDAIRKQHESEMVKLRAILRKEELKSKSLNEIVEQKTKENEELTQILDEVIARVGAKSDD